MPFCYHIGEGHLFLKSQIKVFDDYEDDPRKGVIFFIMIDPERKGQDNEVHQQKAEPNHHRQHGTGLPRQTEPTPKDQAESIMFSESNPQSIAEKS